MMDKKINPSTLEPAPDTGIIPIWRKCPRTGFIETNYHHGTVKTLPEGWTPGYPDGVIAETPVTINPR